MEFIAYYNTATELTDKIAIKRETDQGWTPIYQLTVANVLPGDIFTIPGKAQATNNLHKPPISTTSNNVGLGSALVYVTAAGEYSFITYWTGSNVDARLHHANRSESAVWRVPPGAPSNLIVRFLMKSAALQAKAGWTLRVDSYGNMSIKHERP